MAKMLTVDVYSDIACPWCYVGEKKFAIAREKFLKENPDCSIKVHWHAYMIDPATKKQGEDYMAYNVRRWGGDGWTYDLKEAGKKVGCNFANWKIWPNTFLAHCVVAAAQKQEKGEDALNEIFAMCYEKGENVSDAKTLGALAEKLKIGETWKTKEIQEEVLKDDNQAKDELDIHGVPYFILGGKMALEGAQDPATFVKAFSGLMK